MIANVKQFASLTAVGAGALVLAGGTAEAGIINPGILNTVVAFTNTSTPIAIGSRTVATHTFLASSLGPNFKVKLVSRNHSNEYLYRLARFSGGNRGTIFDNRLSALPFGATVNAATGGNPPPEFLRAVTIGGRTWEGGDTLATASYADQYYLFRFTQPPGSQLDYGWIELNLSATSDDSASPADGPTVTIVQYAWDNTGATITAGEGAESEASPEPSTLAESGLAALILGAAGLRRWRKARLAA